MADVVSSLFSLGDKAAIVSGASSGIGESMARTLVAAGCQKIAVLGRRRERLEALAQQLREKHPGVIVAPITCDVADTEDVVRAFDKGEATVGAVFDVMVCNAGAANDQPILDLKMPDLDWMWAVNVRGTVAMAQEGARRLLKANKSGSIINVSSILGIRVTKNNVGYAMTKAAVNQFTRGFALELARTGVRVNAICPGYYMTEMTQDFLTSEAGKFFIKRKIPSQKIGEVKDLDGALLLLATDASTNINGICLPVDGGHLVSGL